MIGASAATTTGLLPLANKLCARTTIYITTAVKAMSSGRCFAYEPCMRKVSRLARAAPKALVCQLLEVALCERVSLAPTGEGANYREGQGDRDAAARAHLEAKAKTLSAPLESQLHQAVGLNSVALVGGVWAYRLAAAEGYGVQLLAVEGALVVVSAVGFYLVATLRRDLARGAASWARYVEPG